MRARNKADRERQRRQDKLNALNDDIQEAYGNLAGDISTIDRGDTTEADEADEEDDDLLDDGGNVDGEIGGKSSSSRDLKKRKIDAKDSILE